MSRTRRENGEGSVTWHKGNESWYYWVWLNHKRIGGYEKDKKKAKAKLLELRLSIKEGNLHSYSNRTLGDYLEQWLDTEKRRWREKTYDDYATLIRKHINPILGRIQLKKLTSSHIDQAWGRMLDKGVSKQVVVHCHNRLTTALNKAVQQQLIAINPTQGATKPKVEEREIHFLSEVERTKLLKAARDTEYYSTILTGLRTGLRRGELAGLRWRDIDFREGLLQVNHSLVVKPGGEKIWGPPKTKTSRRTIPLGNQLAEHLRDEWEKQVDRGKVHGYEVTKDSSVFIREDGGLLLPRAIYGGFKRIVRRLGLDDVRPHDLRHTHASMLIEANEHIKVIQERLGHEDIRTTLNTYGHLMEGLQKGAMERFDERYPLEA